MQVERSSNFAVKIPYLAIFKPELKKTIVMLDCNTFTLQKCNISCKKTFLNRGPRLSYLGIFGLELKKATVLWYFTSTPSNFSNPKISTKNKNVYPRIC